MDGTPRLPGPRTPAVLARVAALALAAGLLTGCGSQGGDADTAAPGADLGYGAQPPATATATQGGTAATQDGATATQDDAGASTGREVIVIEGFDYVLPDSVPPGAEIVVRNLDGVGHTVTADEGDAFDVVVGPGSEVTFTAPTEEGEYPFHCMPHPAMTGTLVVEGDGS